MEMVFWLCHYCSCFSAVVLYVRFSQQGRLFHLALVYFVNVNIFDLWQVWWQHGLWGSWIPRQTLHQCVGITVWLRHKNMSWGEGDRHLCQSDKNWEKRRAKFTKSRKLTKTKINTMLFTNESKVRSFTPNFFEVHTSQKLILHMSLEVNKVT